LISRLGRRQKPPGKEILDSSRQSVVVAFDKQQPTGDLETTLVRRPVKVLQDLHGTVM
jgi:hypothetical protein